MRLGALKSGEGLAVCAGYSGSSMSIRAATQKMTRKWLEKSGRGIVLEYMSVPTKPGRGGV